MTRWVEVCNPVRLSAGRIPAERIPLGPYYKPCVMKLPSGELRVIAFHGLPMPTKRYREEMVLFRSMDGGLTFSEPETLDLPGREPYFSLMDDGTIFITAHILALDVRNTQDYAYSYLHRSEDGGRTWQTVTITAERLPGAPREPECILSSRNVLQLADGTIIFGVCAEGSSSGALMMAARRFLNVVVTRLDGTGSSCGVRTTAA